MKVITQPLGPVEANCYVLIENGKALIIDPGDDFIQLKELLIQESAIVEAVLLTHAHFDHIGGLDQLINEYQVDVYMNPKEFAFLNNIQLNGSAYFYQSIQSNAKPKPIQEGMQTIGSFSVWAKTLPGHSIGSTIYCIDQALFTGDVLFQGSVGRVDLPTGNEQEMIESIHFLKTLPSDLIVYPGHGPKTTIGQEIRSNPYFRL